MIKDYQIAILLLTVIIAISGCTTKTAPNGTFGEKVVSVNSILISNNTTTAVYDDNGTNYYYIRGYLINNNNYEAFHVELNTTAYDANGNVVATNNSAYIDPNTIAANSISHFFIKFNDTNQKIVRYDAKVVYATGTF
jgi:hypothetical protein